MKLYKAVAAGLIAEGVDKMFGLMGDGNIHVWATLVKHGRVEIVSSGHEQAAVAMADGYARATGKYVARDEIAQWINATDEVRSISTVDMTAYRQQAIALAM
jgi:glyoxylate carboligase